MINKPRVYDETQVYEAQERLPAGGYVLKILNTRIDSYHWGQVLVLMIDVAEGEYADFYKKNYDEQQENKKWKGTFRINLPKDDGTEQDSWAVKKLKSAITAIEKSNEGYSFNWDENTLKNKLVGGLFGNKEYEYNGSHGFYTDCRTLCSVERIRAGKFEIPADKMLKNDNPSSGTFDVPEGFTAVQDSDIPF